MMAQAFKFADEALDALVATREAVLVDHRLPDRHRVAAAREAGFDMLAMRFAGALGEGRLRLGAGGHLGVGDGRLGRFRRRGAGGHLRGRFWFSGPILPDGVLRRSCSPR